MAHTKEGFDQISRADMNTHSNPKPVRPIVYRTTEPDPYHTETNLFEAITSWDDPETEKPVQVMVDSLHTERVIKISKN